MEGVTVPLLIMNLAAVYGNRRVNTTQRRPRVSDAGPSLFTHLKKLLLSRRNVCLRPGLGGLIYTTHILNRDKDRIVLYPIVQEVDGIVKQPLGIDTVVGP